ncbi:hypothetical protein T484DRAFT_1913898, partial [Baffinella frigidus]
ASRCSRDDRTALKHARHRPRVKPSGGHHARRDTVGHAHSRHGVAKAPRQDLPRPSTGL